MAEFAVAVPGELATRTGGYGYDRAVIAALREAGHAVTVLALGDTFPHPSPAHLAAAHSALAALPPGRPVLVDGLAYAALPPATLAAVRARKVALVHHPLAQETGRSPAEAARLLAAERLALSHADAVVTTSGHTAATLANAYGVPAEAITVARPGLDPVWHQPGTPADPPRLVTVGSLIPRKGHDVLLAALARLTALPWHQHIVGSQARDPATARALGEAVAAAGLAGRVTLHGEADDAAIRTLYREAALFVLASRHEGFGMVFGEAMASGLPVVACRAGAVPEAVPPEAGILVPPDDPGALAAALARLLTDGAERAARSAAARAAALAMPDWPATARTIARAAAP